MTEAGGIGARLRAAREAQGLAIDDVAQQLKFAPRQIESLESERFDRLPGPTIARGMVRNYARLLKLDAEPLLQRMGPQAESRPDAGQIAERFRQEVPFSDTGRRSTLAYAGFSIGLLVLVGVLAYEWQQQKAAPEFVAPASERREPAESAPAAAALPAPAPAAPVVAQPAPPPAAAEKVQEEKWAAEKKAETAPPAEKAEKAPAPGTRQIVLRTTAEAWIEIKDGSGRMLISSLNPAGTERALRGRAPFELVIGNAAAVTLTYDGKPVDLRPHTKVEVARLTLK